MTEPSLSIGKLDPEVLRRVVFGRLGAADSRVVFGPKVGEDASIIDFEDRVLVVHSDPITGAVENVGWLAVNIVANDIAACGVRPLWMLVVLLLPEDTDSAMLELITRQIDAAAKELGVAIVGGHSEVTASIKRPIIVATAMGEVEEGEFVQSGGAKVGDYLIVTKGAAIEGTAILASELAELLQGRVDPRIVQKARKFIKRISVVKDALTAIKVGGVHAMHDVTEGGIAGALQEMAWASNVGLVAYESKIPISSETEEICHVLGIDPLRTIGSGALIISAELEDAENIKAALRKTGIEAAIVGNISSKKESYIVRKDGTKLDLNRPVKEELWAALKKHQ